MEFVEDDKLTVAAPALFRQSHAVFSQIAIVVFHVLKKHLCQGRLAGLTRPADLITDVIPYQNYRGKLIPASPVRIAPPLAAASYVPNPLEVPIASRLIGMLLTVFLPISGMNLAPVLPTSLLIGSVIRIGVNLRPLPCRLPGTLTFQLPAVPGILLPWVRRKIPTAMTTRHLFHRSTAINQDGCCICPELKE